MIMKKMRKVAGMLMAATVAMAMPMSAMAANITVEKAVKGATYSAYRVFDYTKDDNGGYSYTISDTSPWYNFIKSRSEFTLTPTAKDPHLYVVTSESLSAEVSKDITKRTLTQELANAMKAEAKNITPEKTVTVTEDTASFDIQELGYYFVDTTTGTLCSLINSSDDEKVAEKNELPTLTKTITNIDKNTSDNFTVYIGETVNYAITVNKGKGTTNEIIVHDEMNEHLSLNNDIVVTTADGTVLTKGDQLGKGDYTINTSPDNDNCTFEITLNEDYVKSMADNASVTITYSATVLSTGTSGEPMENKAHIQYLEKENPPEEVDVYEYSFNLKKVIKDTDTVLSGAEFELREGDKPLYFVEDKNDADELIGYHVVPKGTTGATTTIVAGEVTIRGLKNGTYSLVEIKAPQGYNLLDKAESVVISNANKADIVTVENSKGIQLPSTGGIGITIFYAAGIVVMAGAVFFVVRSRKHD